jgi:hypothetical protein
VEADGSGTGFYRYHLCLLGSISSLEKDHSITSIQSLVLLSIIKFSH